MAPPVSLTYAKHRRLNTPRKEQVRALLVLRIESVVSLVKARQRVDDLTEQLVEAEWDDKRAYVAPSKTGEALMNSKSRVGNSAAGR